MVSASDIPIISLGRYTVDSSGNFTTDMFNSFLAVATARQVMDAPDLIDVLKERAIGLLICHYIETGYGRTHLKSVSVGTGQTSIDESGSSWMKEYRDIIQSYILNQERTAIKSTTFLSGITHTDSTMRGL